jgi:hypothetical protein
MNWQQLIFCFVVSGDALDNHYMELKISEKYPSAGEGAYARVDIPANTIYSLYSGHIFPKDEFEKFKAEQDKKAKENNWTATTPEHVATWKYRFVY